MPYLQVPAHCRWQELKDFVRQTAQHIRQAVVYDDPHGYPTGIGQIIVKNEDEAWRTFRGFSFLFFLKISKKKVYIADTGQENWRPPDGMARF